MQAIFSLAGKNRVGYEYVFAVKRAGKTLLEKYDHGECKVQLSLTLTPVYALAKKAKKSTPALDKSSCLL